MATYRPDPGGAWFAAVRGAVVLIAPASSVAELASLWTELAADDPTSVVLDRLTAGGLASTPPFALVVRAAGDSSARVVVRGDLTVRAGDAVVTGAGVATWAERLIDAATVEVTASAPDDGGPELPVVEGVVAAASVRSEDVESVAAVASAVAVAAPVAPVASGAVPVAPAPAPERPAILAPPAPAAEQTMVPAEDTLAGPATPAPLLDGDHDGLTVASIDLRRLRAERAARATETPAPGVAVDGASRPGAVTLRMPDGAIEPLGHEVVLGRAPSVSQVSGARLPRLITIGAGDPDISRSHVRIAVEGDTVVVTDLHSRNGTHVVAPGKPPVKLRAGEPTPVLAGTVVDLGGGCTVQVVAD
ncbi:FHA domain-containing protein [Agromyces bauzanensis]